MKTRDVLFAWMVAHLNIPYLWGGDDPLGFDCSGIAQEFYKVVGIDPPGDQTASNYWWHFQDPSRGRVLARDEAADFGDMAFFGAVSKPSHIAVVVNPIIIFEAGGGGSSTTSVDAAMKQNAWVRFAPLSRRNDRAGIIRLHNFPKE